MVVPPVTDPPTLVGSTVTVVVDEFSAGQTPFWTTALNWVVCDKVTEVYVKPVFIISVHVLNGDTELCHFTTVPVCPAKVNVPLVLPEQMVVPPVTPPPKLSTLKLPVLESPSTLIVTRPEYPQGIITESVLEFWNLIFPVKSAALPIVTPLNSTLEVDKNPEPVIVIIEPGVPEAGETLVMGPVNRVLLNLVLKESFSTEFEKV